MTGSTAALTALGIAPLPAEIIGDTITTTLAGAGTSQTTATLLTGTVNSVTAASSQTAFILKAHNAGRTTEVYNTSSTPAIVFPPTGATIDGGTATTGSVSIAQNRGRIFRFVTPLLIVSVYGS